MAQRDSQTMLIIEQPTSLNMHVNLQVEDGAIIDVITLITGNNAPKEIEQRGIVGESATIRWWNIALPSKNLQWDLQTEIAGARGESTVNWLFYAKKKEKYDFSVRNIFNARDGRGEITVKGVAEECAHVAANGMIKIGLQGGGTDTYLTEEVLMLDASAKVDAVPGLEIKTNDVKASHSATVTKVSEEDLFYFGSRGIDLKTARRMYIEGFLGSLIESLQDENQRKKILEAIEKKIG